MARVVVIGASQGIGLETVKAALTAGHAVCAVARRASKIAIDDPYLEKFNADARDPAATIEAINGADAVIQTLGVALNPDTILKGTRLFSEATRVLVDAMKVHGPRRLLVVTGLGAGNSRDRLGPFAAAAFQMSLRRIYDDKDSQEMIVQHSRLDWTIVRPGFLTNATRGTYRALTDPKDWRSGPVARADVAKYLIDHLSDPATFGTTPALIA